MKIIKSILVLMVFACSATINAQSAAQTEWKELATVGEIIERIQHSASQGNVEAVRHFSETLTHATTTMVNSKIPVAYKNAKRQTNIRKLGQKVKQISELVAANAADPEILTNFEEARSLYLDISNLSK